ncbi:MAG: hypothetical protein ACT4TC_08055 [Myxococcaceae bacterium]
MKRTLLTLSLAVSAYAFAADPTDELVGQGKMQHCPSAVPGAKSEVSEQKGKLEITITGGDEAEIRKRAKHVVLSAKENPTGIKHSGSGHGGGGLGLCPIVLKDTVVTEKDVPGGSKITVKPTKAIDFEWLKKETKERQAALDGNKTASK